MAELEAGREDLAAVLDIGQRLSAITFLTDGLYSILPIEDDELEAVTRLPLSLRIPVITRLQENLDNLRDVVATLGWATAALGLSAPE